MLCPSTPAAPLLARTFVQAAASVSGANTLSINAYHLPPLTPLTSADSIRFVQTVASTHEKSRAASPPCVAAILKLRISKFLGFANQQKSDSRLGCSSCPPLFPA